MTVLRQPFHCEAVVARKNKGEYALFLEKIPFATRDEVAKSISNAPIENLKDFSYLCSGIIAEIVRGNIPPSVADAAQPYAELMYTAIISSSKSNSPNANTFATVLGRLQEAANNAKTLEAKYVVDAPQKEKELVPVEAPTAVGE